MELDTLACHDPAEVCNCGDDSTFPLDAFAEKPKDSGGLRPDGGIFHGGDSFAAAGGAFEENLKASRRQSRSRNDLMVVSSSVGDFDCDSFRRLNLVAGAREMPEVDKERARKAVPPDAGEDGSLLPGWTAEFGMAPQNGKLGGAPGHWARGASAGGIPDASGRKRAFDESKMRFQSAGANAKRSKSGRGRERHPGKEGGGGSRMPPWHAAEIEDMAADLDGSLTALSNDLTAASYNMSGETLLSLPSLTVFKQEAPSPLQESALAHQNLQQNLEEHHEQNATLQSLLQHQTFHCQVKRSCASGAQGKSKEMGEKKNVNCRFQYVLAAATSIATKRTEETLTYLNQGQSYEIKLKKVGELSNFRGKILKSVIRICFHERRLQYMQKEQILAWQASRPGERIVELDVPLSYGLFDVEQDPSMLNMLSFLWDPTKEVGAYIKVNCISTEFTPKKHGGEKGVPFRIQVETFIEGETNRLHAAACQIKVFKLKGADRKHKQDRERILKRPPSEQDKYQPSYECTVLSDLLPDAVFEAPSFVNSSTSVTSCANQSMMYPAVDGNDASLASHSPLQTAGASLVSSSGKVDHGVALPDRHAERARSPVSLECPKSPAVQLTPESSSQQTAQWLRKNSFENYISTFCNFSGADIFRLTREDLIQICGLADGIRLLYALHAKAIVRLTVYFCVPGSTVFHAAYLDQIGRHEMSCKLAATLGVHHNQIRDIYLEGPNGIRVLVTDEVVCNIKDESMFSVEVLSDETCDRFVLLLKPAPGRS